MPDYFLPLARQIISDPSVYVHPPYRDVKGLVEAHAGIDLMLCPSLSDLGPNILIEGYQLGTPILASNLCGAISDLPENSVGLVTAPRWWQQREKAGAFTERLIETIAHFHTGNRPTPQSRRPDVSFLTETIVQTWENLLLEFL